MILTDNYSISRLFIQKNVSIFYDKKLLLILNFKTVREFFNDQDWNGVYHILTLDKDGWLEMFPKMNLTEPFDYVNLMLFNLGQYKQYSKLVDSMTKYLQEIINDLEIDFVTKTLKVHGVSITSEIWDYVVYLLKLNQGEKVTQPRTFQSPEERAFYLKQMEYERKIKKIRQNDSNNKDQEGLIKTCLYIIYSFPSLTLDYLFDQTMAQIYWLQKMAAGSISYSFNEKAFAAGNVKKGKKLDFFIK